MDRYKETKLWKKSLGSHADDNSCAKLKVAYEMFRKNVSHLVGKISADLPNLTVHDVSHLDALWEIADLIAGDDYPLNPLEGFILGGAILLHDAALTFEAYEKGLAGIQGTVCWQDAYAYDKQQHPEKPDDERKRYADFIAIRRLHSERAGDLAVTSWALPGGEPLYLIDDLSMRRQYGGLIGKIAASHHWNVNDLESNLPTILIGPPPDYPREWTVDAIKIACLLRCADAAHIDKLRAPDFLYALTKRAGLSLDHWQAQNRLAQVVLDPADKQTLVFTTISDFSESEASAWWVAYDALCLIEKELADCNNLLARRHTANPDSPPFKVKKVAGVGSPEKAKDFLRTNGWLPTASAVHVSDVQALVSRLGGLQLYGMDADRLKVALRELIQNARDAVVARRCLETDHVGEIRISMVRNGEAWEIEVSDNGVGMSRDVMTGALLDFGFSFWSSDLVHHEFPGLRSRKFQPIGRFGIGFYSVFMAAKGVRIESRRFTQGLESVHSLLFPNGLSLRPNLKVGRSQMRSQTSTRAILTLIPGMINDDGTIPFSYHNSKKRHHASKDIKLSEYIAALVPGVDVDIYCQGELIHKKIESIIEDGVAKSSWLASFLPASIGDNLATSEMRNLSANLRPLYEQGRLCGLAAINSVDNGLVGLSAATIGGFSTSGLGPIVGYLEYEAEGAARKSSGTPLASPDVLQRWAEEQLQLLITQNAPPQSLAVAGQSFLRMGLLLENSLYYCLAQLAGEKINYSFLSLTALIEIMKRKPITGFSWHFHNSISVRTMSFDGQIITYLTQYDADAYFLVPFCTGHFSLTAGDEQLSRDYTFSGLVQHVLAGGSINYQKKS